MSRPRLHPPRIIGLLLLAHLAVNASASGEASAVSLKLLPYPQEVRLHSGELPMGPPEFRYGGQNSATDQVAAETLRRSLPTAGSPVLVRLGSVEEGYPEGWLSADDRVFLASEHGRNPEASVVTISRRAITVVGQSRRGMLYGAQTVCQLARQGRPTLPCATIRDWPDMPWRCLSPTLTWYSGWNRLEGYDLCNWSLDEWKWLVDWSLLHKMNAWAVCMYGYWPFAVPGCDEATLQVPSFRYDPVTGQRVPYRFVHPNLRREFLPQLIRYANARGIRVYAYIGKNSFNGGYILHHPEANAGGAAEALPFAPGVHEYWDKCVSRILESGFNGFVFEDPETLHVPNQNEQCYQTFWAPWAETYGFGSRADTDANKPPLGVHVEYYGWLFREFQASITRHARRLGRQADVFLISHMLLSRMVSESQTEADLRRWFDLMDEKHGTRVQFIVNEWDEARYTKLLGGDRVASLGGRGGSCLCAWRRMTGVNNSSTPGPMGASVDWERDCQRRIYAAGGRGAMGYVFEWRSNEIYGYIAAQHLWRNAGVPGLDNQDQTGFLDYAYRVHYGDRVGPLVAAALDTSPCVNDAMVLEDVHGAQYPETGRALHRDYQVLAAQADQALSLATEAYQLWTGHAPDLDHPDYAPATADPQGATPGFHWAGYDPRADHLFKAESLRWLCVELRRAQVLCQAALAHGLAARQAAEGAPLGEVMGALDQAAALAAENQRLYQVNFDDDYDWNDGLCVKLTHRFDELRQFLALAGQDLPALKVWDFTSAADPLGWSQTNDLSAPRIEDGALVLHCQGRDPFVVNPGPVGLPCNDRQRVVVEMAADGAGMAELFWWTTDEAGPAYHELAFRVSAGDEPVSYTLNPQWQGTLAGLRLDTPDEATVRLTGVRIIELPADADRLAPSPELAARPVPPPVRRMLGEPLHIPWQKLTDLVPTSGKATAPGLYLSVDLGLNALRDPSCHAVVFTVEVPREGGWRPLFRRTVGKNATHWEHWDIPLTPAEDRLTLRLLTDAYSRTQYRDALSWDWPLWGRSEVVRVAVDGTRQVLYRLADRLDQARPFVVLDRDGREQAFTAPDEDASGATFRLTGPGPLRLLREGEGRDWQWIAGFVDSAHAAGPHGGGYRGYLGVSPSWWGYAYEDGRVSWETAPVPLARETAVAFIGGTNYEPGRAELWCDGSRLLTFTTGAGADARWEEGGVELRYLHGGDTRDARIPYGLSGVFVLRLPAQLVTPGEPLHLEVRLLGDPANSAWFMLHGYADVLQAAERVAQPEPPQPAILATPPHLNGAPGVTGSQYTIRLAETS